MRMKMYNTRPYVYQYVWKGEPKDFPTEQDLEALDLEGVLGLCCMPNTTDKYPVAILMRVEANTPEADKIYQQVQKIFNKHHWSPEIDLSVGRRGVGIITGIRPWDDK